MPVEHVTFEKVSEFGFRGRPSQNSCKRFINGTWRFEADTYIGQTFISYNYSYSLKYRLHGNLDGGGFNGPVSDESNLFSESLVVPAGTAYNYPVSNINAILGATSDALSLLTISAKGISNPFMNVAPADVSLTFSCSNGVFCAGPGRDLKFLSFTGEWVDDCIEPEEPPIDEPDDTALSIAPLIADEFKGFIACAFIGAKVTSGKRSLQIAVGENGWIKNNRLLTYKLMDIDENSPVGLVFMPNGWLSVFYMSGANSKCRINKKFGFWKREDWEAEIDVNPDVAGMLASGKNIQDLSWAMRFVI